MRRKPYPFNTITFLQYKTSTTHFSADILWMTISSDFLYSRNLYYHRHVNVILCKNIYVPEKKIKKNVIYFGALWFMEAADESRGNDQCWPPRSGIVKKRACRWGGSRRKMHESKITSSVVASADWAGNQDMSLLSFSLEEIVPDVIMWQNLCCQKSSCPSQKCQCENHHLICELDVLNLHVI